ncbi:HemK2/MTQ2 family protein methyltransferase [Pyrococcus woesei]|uniref:HemK2/MTQ2 family protein methyltransferase n=1 Tax=Pyrococcus woesei TaxID=2262 RepID=UPI003D2EAE13
MRMEYMGLKIEISEEVYEPAEDSFLLAEVLLKEVRDEDIVLDMGTGSGILALLAAKKAKFVVGVDINERAVDIAWKNAVNNDVKNVIFVKSDLFENIRGRFSLIVFNPPYLLGEDEEIRDPIDLALIGGKTGGEVIERFAKHVKDFLLPGGRVLLLYSSLTKINVRKLFDELGFKTAIVAKEKLFFEELYVMKAELSLHFR